MDAGYEVPDLAPWLDLLAESPTFVLIEPELPETPHISRVDVVPAEAGTAWVAAEITPANGSPFAAIVRADTNGGELNGAYVKRDGTWYTLTDTNTTALLGLEASDVYPFEYRFAVPFERDHFH